MYYGSYSNQQGSGPYFIPNANYSAASTWKDGASLTITDVSNSLPTKPTALPQWWFDFAAGTLTPNATYTASANSYDFESGNAWDSGSGSGISNVPGTCFGDLTTSTSKGPRCDVLGNGNTSVASLQMLWHCVKAYNYDPGIATSYNTNLKSKRSWAGWPIVGGSQNNAWVDENCNNAGAGVPGGAIIAFNNGVASLFPGGYIPTHGNVYVEEVQIQGNSAQGVQDGIFQHIRNAQCIGNPSHRFTNTDASNTSQLTVMNWDQISSNTEPGGAGVWITSVYGDNTWVRAVWSPEPAWQFGTSASFPTMYQRTILIPLSTAVGAWTVVNRTGIYSSVVGQYLYIVKSDGSAFQIGYLHP